MTHTDKQLLVLLRFADFIDRGDVLCHNLTILINSFRVDPIDPTLYHRI
jgi:hypothetical protein